MKHIINVLKRLTISFLIISTVMTNTTFVCPDDTSCIAPLVDELYTDSDEFN